MFSHDSKQWMECLKFQPKGDAYPELVWSESFAHLKAINIVNEMFIISWRLLHPNEQKWIVDTQKK